MILKCPICDYEIDLSDDIKPGDRITCPNCFAQLAFHHHRKKTFLACPTCKEEIFDPANCEDCDRRTEKKKLLNEGRL